MNKRITCCDELKDYASFLDQQKDGSWNVLDDYARTQMIGIVFCPYCGSKLPTTIPTKEKK